jgi:transcriptional regulator with XRE-family HTH domain
LGAKALFSEALQRLRNVEFLEIIGERIRNRIKLSGAKSVEQFAHENDIPKSTLSELLNGKNNPRLTTLAKICAGLEMSLADLFDHEPIASWVREAGPNYTARTGKAKFLKKKPVNKG